MPFLTSTNLVVIVSGVPPIISTEGITPVISVQDATINQKGAVQLEDSFTSKNVKEPYEYTTTVFRKQKNLRGL